MEYYLTTTHPIDPYLIKTFTLRVTNYTEVCLPTSESTLSIYGRTTETVVVFKISCSTPDPYFCDGSVVLVYYRNANMSAKVYLICDFSIYQRPAAHNCIGSL